MKVPKCPLKKNNLRIRLVVLNVRGSSENFFLSEIKIVISFFITTMK